VKKASDEIVRLLKQRNNTTTQQKKTPVPYGETGVFLRVFNASLLKLTH
jgi:hypothetical protein